MRRHGRGGNARHGEDRFAANRDAVGQAEAFQARAEGGIGAVVGIDDDGRDREVGLLNGAHLRQRDAPLLAELDGRRQADRVSSIGILGPRHRQIQIRARIS